MALLWLQLLQRSPIKQFSRRHRLEQFSVKKGGFVAVSEEPQEETLWRSPTKQGLIIMYNSALKVLESIA